MRTSDDRVNRTLDRQIVKTFAQTLADFKNSEEVTTFISDFFTESELETFSKRLAVAYWLKKGRSYVNIKNNLKVSSATIAEISSMRKTKGFELAIKKMEAEEWANVWSERIKKFVKK